jgi:hypothetical protein
MVIAPKHEVALVQHHKMERRLVLCGHVTKCRRVKHMQDMRERGDATAHTLSFITIENDN